VSKNSSPTGYDSIVPDFEKSSRFQGVRLCLRGVFALSIQSLRYRSNRLLGITHIHQDQSCILARLPGGESDSIGELRAHVRLRVNLTKALIMRRQTAIRSPLDFRLNPKPYAVYKGGSLKFKTHELALGRGFWDGDVLHNWLFRGSQPSICIVTHTRHSNTRIPTRCSPPSAEEAFISPRNQTASLCRDPNAASSFHVVHYSISLRLPGDRAKEQEILLPQRGPALINHSLVRWSPWSY